MREMKLNAIMPSQGEKRFINLVEKSHKWIADKLLAHLHQGIFHIPKSTSDVFSPQYFWNQGNQQSTSLTPASNSPKYFLTLGFTSLCMSGGSGDKLAMNRILQESRPCSGYWRWLVSSILLEPALSCWASLLATCLLWPAVRCSMERPTWEGTREAFSQQLWRNWVRSAEDRTLPTTMSAGASLDEPWDGCSPGRDPEPEDPAKLCSESWRKETSR